MSDVAWAWVRPNRRRYSPVRRNVDGTPILDPITEAVEAQLDRDQLAGRLHPEWVPPGFSRYQ